MSTRRRRRRSAPPPRRRLVFRKRWLAGLAALGLVALVAAWLLLLRPPDTAGALARAQTHEAAGEMRAARVEAMNAVQGAPRNGEAWLTLARAQLALGDGESAAFSVMRARAFGIAPAETRHLMAEAALDTGDIDRALAETATADIPPAHLADAARMRGRAFAMSGDPERAAAAFAFAVETGPETAKLWTDIARFRIGTGELGGAIEAADRAVALDPRDVEALTVKGRLVRSQYGLVASLAWFDRALAIDDADLPALLERAATLGEVGRNADMLVDIRHVLELDPGNTEARYLEAVLAARARNFTLARRLIELIDGALDDRPAMMLFESAIDFHEQNYGAAIRRLDTLLELQPANRNALRLMGAAQFHSGDLGGVIATLGPLADRGDADSYILTLVGRAHERSGDFARAAPYLQRAASPVRGAGAPIGLAADDGALADLERAARNGNAADGVALVRAYLARGWTGDALARAARLRAANPGAPDAHMLYGDSLGAEGRFADAAAAYATAANIRFSAPLALRMVEALQRAGQPAEAQRTLALYRQQNPRDVPTALVSAQINLSGGHWRRAAAILEYVRTITGDRDAAVLANLAWAWHEIGEESRARALARRAYLLLPASAATSEIYGWVLFDGGGNRAQGLELMEKARATAPGDPGVQWHLAQAYAALGRRAEARTAARNALSSPRFGARDEAQALLARL